MILASSPDMDVSTMKASLARHSLLALAAAAIAMLTATSPVGAVDRSPSARPADLTRLPPGRPVKVTLNVELLQVSRIEDHEEEFDVAFDLFLRWKDSRLAFDGRREGRNKRIVPVEEIWTPAPDLMDDLAVNVQDGRSAHVLPDGTVLWRRTYRGTVSSNFDLHEFPFDAHRLELRLQANSTDINEVLFVAGECNVIGEKGSRAYRPVPHGWKLAGVSSTVSEMQYARLGETFSRLLLHIDIRRNPHYYWWAIVLPLLPIVAASWSVFWMDPREFNTQAAVGMTAMLTVVAYRISIDSNLPLLSYMTRMDYFLLLCQVWVFVAFLTSVAIHICHSRDTEAATALAYRLSEYCRWLPPLVLATACVLLALAPPGMAMALLAATAAAGVLACRPTPGRVAGWFRAVFFPERVLTDTLSPPADEWRRPAA